MRGVQFGVVRLRLSKGDLLDTKLLALFDTLAEAESELRDCLAKFEHGFRWSDWDEYEIHVYRDGNDAGPPSPIDSAPS